MRQLIKFAIATVAFFGCLQVASSAQALTYQFTWTGDSDFSATGDFSFNDLDSDGIARSENQTSLNEFTTFNITFKDSSNLTLATYDLNQLQNFLNPGFNFNYDIVNNVVFQTGLSGDPNGFALGDNDNGYLFSTNGGAGISLSDSIDGLLDGGGTLTATAVPFEFSPGVSLGILGAGLAIRKGRQILKTKNINSKFKIQTF